MTSPVVDVHSHYVPRGWPDLAEACGGDDWPSLRVDSVTEATIMLGDREFRRITDACWNADQRIVDMNHDGVDLQTPEGKRTVTIGPGQMWVLPRNLPHSPQRPEAGSIGLVFERPREPGVLEHFQWYCLECNHRIHDVELQVRDIVTDLPPVFEAFYADERARTCEKCGAVHPGKG